MPNTVQMVIWSATYDLCCLAYQRSPDVIQHSVSVEFFSFVSHFCVKHYLFLYSYDLLTG